MSRKRYILSSIIFFSLLSTMFAQGYIELAKKDVELLTSIKFAGRGYTFDGHLKAAQYINGQFQSIGLQPVTHEYFQKFDLEVNIFESVPELEINKQSMKLGEDFFPFATTGSGDAEDEDNIFYLKSGLYIPDKNINDFAGVNRRGAILIIDEAVPDKIKKDKSIKRQHYSRSARIEIAKQIQASAVIFLVDKLSFSTPYKQDDIVIIDILKDRLPGTIESISYEIETSFDDFESFNIIGLLPGTTKPDTNIIICGHYDHLSAFSESLFFPGANDNASGTGMLLSLARYFQANPVSYSILFIAFSGEDAGLIGSKYYAENPVLDLDYTKFLINYDMVASGEQGIMAVGGLDHPVYFEVLKAANDSLNSGKLGKRKNAANGDHYFLTQKGVKAFYIYTNKGTQPYHSFRDVSTTLEWDDFTDVFELSTEFIEQISK